MTSPMGKEFRNLRGMHLLESGKEEEKGKRRKKVGEGKKGSPKG